MSEPVHEFFGLSYCNYLVLPRTLMQSMPREWQERMVACLTEMDAAFEDVPKADYYIVKPAVEMTYDDLTKAQRKLLGVTRSEDGYYHDDGKYHDGWERVLVPAGRDPVPDHARGRAYVQPKPVESPISGVS